MDKILLVEIALLLLIGLIFIMLPIWIDQYKWNFGYCRKCLTKWEIYTVFSSRDRVYKCDECGKEIVIHYNIDGE